MPVWRVKATWLEDETQASEEWFVNSESVQDAIRETVTHVRFQPHHVEAKLQTKDDDAPFLKPGEIRRRLT